jgi:S-methylmethionine-dependent homocysteine/selenocysteine methylase
VRGNGHKLLILDGAMGTELERGGLSAPLPLWSAWGLLKRPEAVREIHRKYLEAGAEVLSAATFRTTHYALAKEGMGSRAEELVKLAVRLAREAIAEAAPAREIPVAGSVAPLEDCYWPELAPDSAIMRREHTLTAQSMLEASCDLLIVETQNSRREAEIAAQAALQTGLPVWVSFVPRSGTEVFNGDSLKETAQAAHDWGTQAVLVNCCPPALAEAALHTLRAALLAGRVGVYPNFGRPEAHQFANYMTPEAFAAWGATLADEADIIGGCCGTTPAHIAALAKAVRKPKMRNEK